MTYDLNISPDAVGAEVREHLNKLQSQLSNFNIVYSHAVLVRDNAKAILAEVEAKAADVAFLTNSKTLRKGVQAKKIGMMSKQVVASDGETYTIPLARKVYNEAEHQALVAKLRLDELKSSLNTYRSILAWDRVEFENAIG